MYTTDNLSYIYEIIGGGGVWRNNRWRGGVGETIGGGGGVEKQ